MFLLLCLLYFHLENYLCYIILLLKIIIIIVIVIE